MSKSDFAGLPVITAAMEMEVKPLVSRFMKVKEKTFAGEIGGEPVLLLVSGIGAGRAESTAAVVSGYKPPFVLNLGFSGGLNPRLFPGDLFLPEEVRNVKGEKIACNPFPGKPPEECSRGILVSTETIAGTREEKAGLSSLADAVDMEAFFQAAVFAGEKIPFFCVKVVSDAAHESLPLDFSPAVKDGDVSTFAAIRLMAKHPKKIFPVIRVGRRASKIAEVLCGFAGPVFGLAKARA